MPKRIKRTISNAAEAGFTLGLLRSIEARFAAHPADKPVAFVVTPVDRLVLETAIKHLRYRVTSGDFPREFLMQPGPGFSDDTTDE